eukprot:746186-Hanusia_phi.AAC.1
MIRKLFPPPSSHHTSSPRLTSPCHFPPSLASMEAPALATQADDGKEGLRTWTTEGAGGGGGGGAAGVGGDMRP